MRALLILLAVAPLGVAGEPLVIAKPNAFETLVNPSCSHCVDEATLRKDELKPSDPVLCWTRGYSEGGAIPMRFFLNKYRVISDSYGVFVHDPDAGYSRGFAPSYNFVFHGWRNGVMTMKDKTDGTLYSCLSGVAFDGPRKGHRLKPLPTLVSTWGEVMKRNPNAVAYHMFDKYKPMEADAKPNADSRQTQLAKVDSRLKPDDLVLGVRVGNKTRAYPVKDRYSVSEVQELGGQKFVVFRDVAAYRPSASQPRKWKGPNPDKAGVSPEDAGKPLQDGKELPTVEIAAFKNSKVGILGGTNLNAESVWGIDGRATDGDLKGWTLEPVETVVCKWYAWSAEYPDTEVFGMKNAEPQPPVAQPKPPAKEKPIAGTAEFLRLLPKPFGVIKAIDPKARTVSLLLDGEKESKVWPVEPDAEVKVNGFWGRLEQFKAGDRVWVWLKLNRTKKPVSVAMLADETSELAIHGTPGLVMEVTTDSKQPADATFTLVDGKVERKLLGDLKTMATVAPGSKLLVVTEKDRIVRFRYADRVNEAVAKQREWLRARWLADGLPGTLAFHHVFSGEMDVILDHEAIRWGRSLKAGDKVTLTADPPIEAVVKAVTPWRERTQLRLVVGELQSSELKPGQRIGVKMTAPAKEVDDSVYPPDLGRKRTDDERVEWFLASMYCVCGVGKDICTGHFYTLSSCNPNGCGAPNFTRDEIRKQIAAGKSDKDIWDQLRKDRGDLMTRPHLRK